MSFPSGWSLVVTPQQGLLLERSLEQVVSTGNDCARRGTAPVMAPSGKAPILVMASQEGGKIL